MIDDIEFEENIGIVEPGEKMIKYIVENDGNEFIYLVTVEFERLQNIVRELNEKCQYRVNNDFKPTYLEYILKSFLDSITSETYKLSQTITYEKSSSNMINNIINYEHCRELDVNNEKAFLVIPHGYKREFDLEVLRNLYEQAKKCIVFKEARRKIFTDGDSISINEIQKLRK